MEYVAAIFAGGEAGGAAAGAGAGTAGSFVAGSGEYLSLAGGASGSAAGLPTAQLMAASTAAGVLGQISSGNQAAAANKLAAGQAGLEARRAELAGQQDANNLRMRLVQTLAQQQAAGYASGIDVGSGSVLNAKEQAYAEANRQQAIIRGNAGIQSAGAGLRRTTLLSNAAAEQQGGYYGAGAGAGLLDYYYRSSRRGY